LASSGDRVLELVVAGKKQIPFRNDRQKSKGKSRGKGKGKSRSFAALRMTSFAFQFRMTSPVVQSRMTSFVLQFRMTNFLFWGMKRVLDGWVGG
jgi:hypothetical protein